MSLCVVLFGVNHRAFSQELTANRKRDTRRPAATVFPGIISASRDPDLHQRLIFRNEKKEKKTN